VNDSAQRRAQIIAGQALREAAAAPTNWRAARKRRSYSTWSTPSARRNEPQAEPAATDAAPSDEPDAKE
jgi:hypothetical protein